MKKWILAVLFLVLAHPAWAVPAFDNSTGNLTAGAPSPTTIGGFAPGGTNRLLTVCSQLLGTSISSMTFGGASLATIATPIVISGIEYSYWRLVNPATSGNLVVTPVDAGGDLNLTIVSYKDVDPITPLGTAVSTSGTVDTSLVTVSSATGELVADCIGAFNGGGTVESATPGTTQTERASSTDDVGSGGFYAVKSSDKAGATSVNMSWDFSAVFHEVAQFAVSLKPVAAPPAGVARRRIINVD